VHRLEQAPEQSVAFRAARPLVDKKILPDRRSLLY
jgi:hypothetical protein